LGDNSEKQANPEDIEKLTLSGVWLELVSPSSEELQAVSDATKVPLNSLKLPKKGGLIDLRLEDNFTVIVFAVQHDVTATQGAYPLVMAFSKDFLVTVTGEEVQPIIGLVKQRMSKTKTEPPSQVAYFIMDEVVASHYTHLEKLETQTSGLEEEVAEGTSPKETIKKIFKLKANMIKFNKALWYERGIIFNLKQCGENCMPQKIAKLFDTTHEDLTRQIDIVETYREILSDAINVHLSAVSNRINLSIKGLTIVIFYLTVITTVTSFPNTVATFFGISQFGGTNVFIIAALLIVSTVLPFVWLWRKKWIKLVEPDESKQTASG